MHDLIGSVASLTGFRDRDLIDTTVVSVLADWLQPLSLSMYRCIGEPQAPRLLLQGGVVRGADAVAGDPPWTPMESLPALADCPTHEQALAEDVPVHGVAVPPSDRFPDGAVLSVFPVSIGPARAGLIEVHSAAVLTIEQQRLIGGVLKIYRNQIGLLDYSERDTLTGLLNRKTFDEQFNKCQLEDAATERYGVAPSVGGMPRYWLGLIDIDHFKRVNDNYGHLMGDEVLLLTAHILRKAFRQADLLYRFGGEEFVVLLRAPSRDEASMAIERFRQQMEDFAFPQAGRVTASIGFTALRPNDTSSSAFERADQAVYHAKENGRNRQYCHEALIESGALQANEKVGAIELF